MNYIRFFPGDYLRDTRDLTWLEDRAYFQLLLWQYATEEPIRDLEHAYMITRPRNKRQKWACCCVLRRYFTCTPEGYWNGRFKKEQDRVFALSSIRREAAKAKQMLKQKHSKSSHISVTRNPLPKKKESSNLTLSSSLDLACTPGKTERDGTWFEILGITLDRRTIYREMRKRIGRPIVFGAEEPLFAKLLELKTAGENPAEVLEQAIATSSYQFYAIKKPEVSHGKSFHEQRSRSTAAALERVLGSSEEQPRHAQRALPTTDQRTIDVGVPPRPKSPHR